MEIAALEIARMSEEIDGLRAELLTEQERRLELEAHFESLQDKQMEIEAEIREECYAEMEIRLQAEMRRWKATWEEERERGENHMDMKLDIIARLGGDDEDKENEHRGETPLSHEGGKQSLQDLENDNARLRRELEKMKREAGNVSPSKGRSERLPLRESTRSVTASSGNTFMSAISRARDVDMEGEFEGLRISDGSEVSGMGIGGKSPHKKVRKLGGRKWDADGEGEVF
jgi:hypothetical protein